MTFVMGPGIILFVETYYTVENFTVYCFSLVIILTVVPLIVYFSDVSRSIFFRLTLWCLVLAAVCFPLSRTCPYAFTALLLFKGCLATGGIGLIMFLITVGGILRRKKDNPLKPAKKDFDRWATEALQGSYLVIDRDGRILGGHLGKLRALTPVRCEFFREYFTLLNENGDAAVPESKGEGVIRRNGRFFRWHYVPLEENKTDGYLFCVQDLTEEHRLLDERSAQEQILSLRRERITRQGILKAREEKIRYKCASVRNSIETVKKSLNTMIDYLSGLGEGDNGTSSDREALEWAVDLGSETIASIRAAVHSMNEEEMKKDEDCIG